MPFIFFICCLLGQNAIAGWTTFQAIIPGTYDGIVATRGLTTIGGLQATFHQAMSRTGHFTRSALTKVRIMSANFSQQESASGAASTITASVEYPQGTCTQILYSGSSSGTIPNGGTLLSDYVNVTIPVNTQFWIRQYYTNTAGIVNSTWNDNTNMGDAYNAAGSGISDQTVICGAVTNAVNNLSFQPMAIIAPITIPSVCIFGDSITAGVNDSFSNSSGDLGIVTRSIGPKFGYANMGVSGDTASNFVSNSVQRRSIVPYCSHVIIEYGVNDLSGGATPATLESNLTSIYGLVGSNGQTVFQTTITPETTSSDSWATVGNQTVSSWDSNRVTFNTALRGATFGPNGGEFDTESVIESSLNSGKWQAGGACAPWTADGVHPVNCSYLQVQSQGVINTARIHRP